MGCCVVAKGPSPLLGFNNNVRHRGKLFHIQTEDSGIRHPHVITHLFSDGGRIIKTTKTSYAEYVGGENMAGVVRQLMKEQHKAMFLALRGGLFDDAIDGGESNVPATRREQHPTGSSVPSGAIIPPPAGAAPPSGLTLPKPSASVERPALAAAEGPPPSMVPPPSIEPFEPFSLSTPLSTPLPSLARPPAPPVPPVPSARGLSRPMPPPPSSRQAPPSVPGRLSGPTAPPRPASIGVMGREVRHPGEPRPGEAPSSPAERGKPPPPPALRAVQEPAAATPEKSPTSPSSRPPSRSSFPRAARPQTGRSIFGDDLISEKSLDEVILSYLADDLDGTSNLP